MMKGNLFFGLVFLTSNVAVADNYHCSLKDTPFQCDVRLPQDEKASGVCDNLRYQETVQQKLYWKLAATLNPGDPNPNYDLLTPRLDQNQQTIGAVARFGQDDMRWFSLYYSLVDLLNVTATGLAKQGFLSLSMDKYADYEKFYLAFTAAVNQYAQFGPHEFSVPSNSPHLYTNIVQNNIWREDKYFIQRRLAGTCPYFIRKVTFDGKNGFKLAKLNRMLNINFDWEKRLRDVTGKQNATYSKAVEEGRIYVLYHEEYNDLDRTADILPNTQPLDHLKLLDSPTPITLFVADEGELKIIAIQTNYTRDSKVVTPNPDLDNAEWLRAKADVEIVEMAMCQIKGHLLDSHVTAESYCNIFRRHFGSKHPLYGFFLAHCEGTTPVGALGITSLVNEERYMHQLFGIGYIGTRQLINKLYEKHRYEDSDFEAHLKKQGIWDMPINDYPYRDDGNLIWNEIKAFAKKYVNIYYKKNSDVKKDDELQEFANEMSANGNAQNGVKYKGFPKSLQKRDQVETFISRFIWLSVLHAANSYPLNKYVPIAPTKLYGGSTPEDDFAHNLPNAQVTMAQSVLTFTLSSLRVNRLFDYSTKLTDQKARCLVRDTFAKLQTCVQKKLEEKNAQRFAKKDLTYQYMEPKWLPNSIHS